jgi:hypothetical protein
MQRGAFTMMSQKLLTAVAAFGVLSVLGAYSVREAEAQLVFQAAGPSAEAIQGAVDAYRAALGDPDNGNNGPQPAGRREINWDGGGAATNTTAPVTPFDVFLNTRGARFITPGTGLSQAPPSGGADGGLAVLFDNVTYGDIFQTFSPQRLFTPVGSRITEGLFFLPGTAGGTPAVVTGFGAVFTDVDKPNGTKQPHSTVIEYFDANGDRIFTALVPAAPGDAGLSFLGVVFDSPVVARVRITTGDTRPGVDDGARDVVMMDDFLYGEPQPIVGPTAQ